MTSAKFADLMPPVQLPASTYFGECGAGSFPLVVISADTSRRLYLQATDEELQAYLAQKSTPRNGVVVSAIRQSRRTALPVDGYPLLAKYILAAQQFSHQTYGRDLYFALRLDASLPAAEVKKLFYVLQQQGITRFNLVTEARYSSVTSRLQAR